MALSAFADPAHAPTPDELAATLGDDAGRRWAALVDRVRTLAPDIAETWRHGGRTFGWSLRLVLRDRVILYLTPQAGTLLAGLALGERAIAAARDGGVLGERAVALVDAAPRYAEGRGIRLAVAADDDVDVVTELVRAKLG